MECLANTKKLSAERERRENGIDIPVGRGGGIYINSDGTAPGSPVTFVLIHTIIKSNDVSVGVYFDAR
jgi:hypothetical protein